LVDLGRSPAHAQVRAQMHERLVEWMSSRRRRSTMPDAGVDDLLVHRSQPGSIEIGVW
jgi:hypothetical protein